MYTSINDTQRCREFVSNQQIVHLGLSLQVFASGLVLSIKRKGSFGPLKSLEMLKLKGPS